MSSGLEREPLLQRSFDFNDLPTFYVELTSLLSFDYGQVLSTLLHANDSYYKLLSCTDCCADLEPLTYK
jgi:hypothetical protein